MRIALALLALLLMAAPAFSQEDNPYWTRYVYKQRCYQHTDMFGAVTYPCFRYRVEARERRYRPPVYAYERRVEREDEPPRAHCLFEHPAIRATGDDKLKEEAAQVSAQDRWAIEVATMRGVRFSDIRNAAHMTAACVKKVPETWTEKKQADAADLRHFVCTIEAVPCAAPKMPVDEDTLAKRKAEKIGDQIGRKDDPRADFYETEAPRKRFLERWRRARQ